jgi:ubiquinone/menaquinone biosynthesis C-methylase UbiE
MSSAPHTALFREVDRSGDPDFFVRFMDEANKPAGIRAGKRLMSDRMGLTAGAAVLDVGCGPGTDALELANLVGSTGRVAGVDSSLAMIGEACRRAQLRRLPVSFLVAQLPALPLADASFDVCRASRLLEHVPDPRSALAEMVRATRSGGRIVVFDIDWDTLVIDHPDKDTTRMVVLSYSDSIRNGWLGRQLPRLLVEQRLRLHSVDAVHVWVHYHLAELFLGGHLALLQTQHKLTPSQAQAWWENVRGVGQEKGSRISFTAFVAAGIKP